MGGKDDYTGCVAAVGNGQSAKAGSAKNANKGRSKGAKKSGVADSLFLSLGYGLGDFEEVAVGFSDNVLADSPGRSDNSSIMCALAVRCWAYAASMSATQRKMSGERLRTR